MSKTAFVALLWASASFGVDLTRYPYLCETQPAGYATLKESEVKQTKTIPTDQVRFLFVSSCDPAGTDPELCLWAYVRNRWEAKVSLESGADGKNFTLHETRLKEEYRYDSLKEHQFVSVLSLGTDAGKALDGISVNGKSVMVTHWVKMRPDIPPVPMVWLPVTPENQVRINAGFHEALRTNPKREVKFYFGDLQARPSAPGEAFFVVLGFEVDPANRENHYFVATRHGTEKDIFTATLKRVRQKDGEAEEFDWMGYTFTTVNDEPTSFESLLLAGGSSKAASRGELTRD